MTDLNNKTMFISGGSRGQSDVLASANAFATFTVSAVPEPSAFICVGLLGLVVTGRRWMKNRAA